MTTSHLKIIVLKILDKKSISGYDLVKEIHSITGNWKPSYGSIYPILKDLYNKKLVSIKEDGRKKIYNLTPYGREQLKIILQSKEEILKTMFSNMKNIEIICDKKEIDFIYKWHKNITNNVLPFKEFTPEIHQIGDLLVDLSSMDLTVKERQELKKSMSEIISKLKKIKENNTSKK